VVFNYLVNYRYGAKSDAPLRLKGLDPGKHYRLREINLYPGSAPGKVDDRVRSGDFLMTVGIDPQVSQDRPSVVLQLKEEPS
jgi:alpha-galactosidase